MPKMIVIEGLDGSGKATQTTKLVEAVKKEGLRVDRISFPCYGETSAVFVEEYLNGSFGKNPSIVNAFAASSFFAMDRFVSYLESWKSKYEQSDVFIADRYTTSNAIHQCSKLPEDQWPAYLAWLFDYEYEKLKLPRPDKVLYLHLSVGLSQRLLDERYDHNEKKKDIHELDIEYLKRSQAAAEFCCSYCGWERIECMREGVLRSVEDIHAEIVERVGI